MNPAGENEQFAERVRFASDLFCLFGLIFARSALRQTLPMERTRAYYLEERSAVVHPSGTSLPTLILASASPRRRELLNSLGLRFEVVTPAFDEDSLDTTDPARLVRGLALGKAESIAGGRPESIVVGADTIVVLDGEILGKPKDPEHAAEMLSRLSARTHQVLTGIAVVAKDAGRLDVEHEETDVTFGRLTSEQIRRYVATGEPLDKAGAYGIQAVGATLVREISGCYFNVVGLPLFRLARILGKHGISIP